MIPNHMRCRGAWSSDSVQAERRAPSPTLPMRRRLRLSVQGRRAMPGRKVLFGQTADTVRKASS
jgi:hypothetical protein